MTSPDPIFWLIDTILSMYSTVIFFAVIVSLLVSFDVINTRNRFVYLVYDFLNRATEPLFARVRRFLPLLGGIDLSPMVVLLGIEFLRRLLAWLWPH